MVDIKNTLSKLPATQAYVDFGLDVVEAINARYDVWLSEQSFAADVVPSQFEKMVVDGNSEQHSYQGEDCQDQVSWNLSFSDKVKNKPLSDALLHAKRLPKISEHNSEPGIFDTADYFEIRVHNSEHGWVKEGTFPKNPHTRLEFDDKEGFPPKIKKRYVPVFTDIRRDALAGFEAAHQWQKFRAMAATCVDFLAEQMKAEFEAREVTDNHSKMHDAQQHRRS